jgi:hypothetical protein
MGRHQYRIQFAGSENPSVLFKPMGSSGQGCLDQRQGIRVNDQCLEIESPVRPVIRLSSSVPDSLVSFIQEEGFLYETGGSHKNCSVYIDSYSGKRDKRRILQLIEDSPYPVLRYWRWPHQKQFCLVITGDIDSVSIWDFWRRYHGRI